MKKIFLLALAAALTIGPVAYAAGGPKGKQTTDCKDCKQKVCTPACKDHCTKGCCTKAK